MPKTPFGFLVGSFIWLCFVLFIAQLERTATTPLLLAYASLFAGYLFLVASSEDSSGFVLGLLARICCFLTLPALSDDIFRFIWDGHLISQGLSPYADLPSSYRGMHLTGLTESLYQKLNSKDYFTVYPPINQGIFWLSVQFSDNWLVAANVIRALLLLADVGIYQYLKKCQVSRPWRMAYWLNPLIILEGVGNLHFEIFVLFFLMMAWFFFKSNLRTLAGVGFGLAAGTKLVPLILAPFLLFSDLGRKQVWLTFSLTLVFAISMGVLFYDESFVSGFKSSIDLYFRRFEFNASLYYLARWIGYQFRGYNEIAIIGPLMAALSFLCIWTLSLVGYFKNWATPKLFLLLSSTYLLFSTTVHPWYIIPLIGWAVLSKSLYPIVWSLLIFITYAGYTQTGYDLPLIWIGLEYILVLVVFIWDKPLQSWLIVRFSYLLKT